MSIRHAVTPNTLLLFVLSTGFFSLAAGEGEPISGIVAKLVAEADKPRMTPEIALPTEAEALAGIPDDLDADQRPEAMRHRREAILARRILTAFIASQAAARTEWVNKYIQEVELSDENVDKWLTRPLHHQFVCCYFPIKMCDSHRYMTPDEHRDEVRAEIELIRLTWDALGRFSKEATKDDRYSDDYRALLTDYRRWATESGFRDAWVMVFVPGEGEDAMESARQRAEAAQKRLMEGFSWEQVAQEDSDNAKMEDTPPNGVLGGISPWRELADTEKLWEKLNPGEVSAPLELAEKYILMKWQPINDKRILDMANDAYGSRLKLAWRSAALAAAVEALRASND